MESLIPDWIPVFRDGAVASSSITWVYSKFEESVDAQYGSIQSLAVGEEACRERCSTDKGCAGFTPNDERCTYYTVGKGADPTVKMGFVKKSNTAGFDATLTINRRVPPTGWQIQVVMQGGALRTPANAQKIAGGYSFNTTLGIMPLRFMAEQNPPTLEVQFVLSRLNTVSRRVISTAKSEQFASGIAVLVAISLGMGWVFLKVQVGKIGKRQKPRG